MAEGEDGESEVEGRSLGKNLTAPLADKKEEEGGVVEDSGDRDEGEDGGGGDQDDVDGKADLEEGVI